MNSTAIVLPRPVVNQSTVMVSAKEKICCPRCEYRFNHNVTTNVVERVVAKEPRSVEDVLRTFDLRPRELVAARCLAEGMSIKAIAMEMATTEGTVKQYLRLVYMKTGTDRRQMLRMKIDELRYA